MNVLYLFCEITFFLGILVIFIINFFIYQKITVIDSQYTISMARNWLNSPIIDIIIGPNCSEGYSLLILDYWPGSVKGCICGSTFYIGSCPSKKYSSCYAISEISSIPYKLWSSTSFCVKRIPYSSYLNLTIANKGEACPSGQKSCGVIDSLGNFLCMRNNETCPINDIQVYSSSQGTIPVGYKTINMNKNGLIKTLAFTNTSTTGKVVVEFKVSDNTPCIDPYFYNKITFSYILEFTNQRDRCIGMLGSQFLDRNYNFLDYTKVFDLYNENYILGFIKDKLPFYPVSQLDLYTRLYYRNYLGLSKSCHDDIKNSNLFYNINEGFNYIQDNYQSFVDIYKGFYIYIIVIWGVVILLYFFFRFYFFSRNHSDNNFIQCFFAIIEIITFLSVLVIMIIYIVFFNQMKSLKNGYINFVKYTNCGDLAFSEAIPSFINSIESTIYLVTWNMSISIGIFITPLVRLFIICCKENDCCKIFHDDYSEYENNMISKRNPQSDNIDNNNNLPEPNKIIELPVQTNNINNINQHYEMYRRIDPPKIDAQNNNDIPLPDENKNGPFEMYRNIDNQNNNNQEIIENNINHIDSLKEAPPVIETLNLPNTNNNNLNGQNIQGNAFNSINNQPNFNLVPPNLPIENNNNNFVNNNPGNQFNSHNNFNYPQTIINNSVIQQEMNANNQPKKYD